MRPVNTCGPFMHLFQTIILHTCKIFAIMLFLAMLQAGDLLICMFSGNFRAEFAVCLPSNKVTAIPDETNATAT